MSTESSAALLQSQGTVTHSNSRSSVAAAQTELNSAAAGALKSAASAGRSANRLFLSNVSVDQLSEVHIGLVATVAIALVIWMVCVPAFDMSAVNFVRSWDPVDSTRVATAVLPPYRRKVKEAYASELDAFNAMDTDGNSLLDGSEFTEGSQQFYPAFGESSAERLFRHMDKDEDGLVNRASFVACISGRPLSHPVKTHVEPGTTKVEVKEGESDFQVGDQVRLVSQKGHEEVVSITGSGLSIAPPTKYSYDEDDSVESIQYLGALGLKRVTRTTTTVTTTTVTTTTVTTTTAKGAKHGVLHRLLKLVDPLFV